MSTIEEKRVYTDQAGTVDAYVAADLGVAVARVSGDTVGEFSLVERCTARDVAATARGVAAATAEDVRLDDGDGFAATEFGPAVAVAGADDGVLAAGEDGRVARLEDDDWTTVGTLDAAVRALEADLVAAADGVYRVTDDGLAAAGLDDVRDVAAAGVPLAATPEGLYRLGAGWMRAAEGAFGVVASDPVTASAGELGRAHAATADDLYEHAGADGDAVDDSADGGDAGDGSDRDGEWRVRGFPVDGEIADVAYATDAVLVLTAGGALAVDAGDGFRHRSLGLREARALAVAAEGNA